MRGAFLLAFVVCVGVFPVCVLSQADNSNTWIPTVDLISATSARLRFLPSFTSSYSSVLIQYQNTSVAGSATNVAAPSTYHTLSSSDSRYSEVAIVHGGLAPITSYILRGLQPSSSYFVQIGYIASGTGTANPTSPVSQVQTITTPALSNNVLLYSLYASGGCGLLTSTGQLYSLTFSTDGINKIYSCTVPTEISSVNVSIIPQYAYASINSASSSLSTTNATVPSSQVDPLVAYNTTLSLTGTGTTYNFTFTVTAENGNNQSYILSITRALPLSTAQLNGPSSPVTAFITAYSNSTSFLYHALLWSSTAVGTWRVWSDDTISFPYSSLNITYTDPTLPTLLVTPVYHNTPTGSCSNVNLALFDQTTPVPRSTTITTCISAVDDGCSSTPNGAAIKWQNPFTDAAGSVTTTQLYFPAPPYTTFPSA